MFKHLSLIFCFLQINGLIHAQCPIILTDDPIEVCESGGTTVSISIEGDIISAHWTPAIGLNDENILNPTLDFPLDTSYTLTIKGLDADSGDTCIVQKEIEIKVVRYELKIALDTVELACGDSVRLKAEVIPNGSFFIMEWEATTGNFLRGEQTLAPLVDEIGTYKANVIGNLGRIVCRDRDSIEVVPTAEDKLSIVLPEKIGCTQNEVTLSLENQTTPNNFNYQWETANGQIISATNQPSIIVNQIGDYQVTRTDQFGECEISTSAQVVAKEALSDFNIVIEKPDCELVTGTIFIDVIEGGSGPFQFSIDDGFNYQSTPIFSNLIGGDYTVLIVDSNDCQLEKDTNFTQLSTVDLFLTRQIEIESGTEFQVPLRIQSNGVGVRSIEWSPRIGLSCYDCEQPSLLDFKSRRYEVMVRDQNDCIKKSEILIQVKEPNLVYQPSVFSPNGDGQNDFFKFYPNSKFVRNVQNFSIFDRYGNLVFRSETNISNGWDGQYKGQAMPVGTYLFWGILELKNGETTVINGALNLVR